MAATELTALHPWLIRTAHVLGIAGRGAGERPRHAYRREVEGLRAVAVVAVLLFHVGFPVAGGYIGVDVFFVISGFLITRNILNDHQAGIFTFRRFYVRRIRRLFPALATTLLATLLAGSLFFAPDDMARLGRTALFAVASLSNVLFWKEIGYFDAAATLKPLLHTWSLAVEEQYYLLWPAVVVLAARFRGTRAVLAVVAAIGAASLVSAELLRPSDPGAVFYLMPFRMFELCAGGALATVNPPAPRPGRAQLATMLGMAAVLYSVARFDATTALHHYWALLPCAGTVLVIYAGENRWSTPLLATSAATTIGTISYSLYLVHWPLVVFYRYLHPTEASAAQKWLLAMLCILLAAMLYLLVERPFRSGGRADRSHVGARAAALACTALAICVSLVGWHAWRSGGWPSRLPPELRSLPSETAMWMERNPHARVGTCFVYAPTETTFDEERCLARDPRKPNYLIIGDSFAADAYVYLSAAYPRVNFMQATAGGCAPVLGGEGDALCNSLRQYVFTKFLPGRHVDGVVLAASWQVSDLDALDRTIDYLRTHVSRIVLVGSGVRFLANVRPLIFQSRRLEVGDVERYVDSQIAPFLDTLNDSLRKRLGRKADAFIDVRSMMCEDHCRLFTPERQLIYIDFGHLTLAGSRFLAAQISSRPKYSGIFSASDSP
ncbi:MAG TPA: acyltransferase family protein [Vicinamibacteria bacterium]|nr:acyltransferase family protein [Vicinamibacteria bacterium]